MLIDIPTGDLPLCPMSAGPVASPAHQIVNRTLDGFYEAADRNADGEMPEPLDRAYHAAAHERMSDRMRLYVASANHITPAGFKTIEAYYFQCGVCGFVLPSTRVIEHL